MPPARVDGSRFLDQEKEYWQMIKINNQKLEKQIKEILQNSKFGSVEEYLSARIYLDYIAIRNKRNPF